MPALNSFIHSWDRSFTVGDDSFMVNCADAVTDDRPIRAAAKQAARNFICLSLARRCHRPRISMTLVFQYCPFGSRPKVCWPYIADTASQFRLICELAA